MLHRPVMPSAASLRLLTGLLLAGAAHAAEAPELRFSQALPAADAAASGLPRLSSDEVAVIDALVRRDTAARLAPSSATPPAAFSMRLTADERRTAGLTRLAPAELARLDDAGLRQLVREELGALLGVRGEPVYCHVQRWPRAIPQYTLGYERFKAIFTGLEAAAPGLHFGGNARDGISLANCIESGRRLARTQTGA